MFLVALEEDNISILYKMPYLFLRRNGRKQYEMTLILWERIKSGCKIQSYSLRKIHCLLQESYNMEILESFQCEWLWSHGYFNDSKSEYESWQISLNWINLNVKWKKGFHVNVVGSLMYTVVYNITDIYCGRTM